MKQILGYALLLMFCASETLAQGTIVFNNRNLTDPATGGIYHAPFYGAPEGLQAELYLVGGDGTYTPLPGINGTSGILGVRPAPDNIWLNGPITVEVPGVPAGTTGVQLVLRAWLGANYETATLRGQTDMITVGALGGVPPVGAPITPPDLGGAAPGTGLESFTIPEPSTFALFVLGAAVLAFRRKK